MHIALYCVTKMHIAIMAFTPRWYRQCCYKRMKYTTSVQNKNITLPIVMQVKKAFLKKNRLATLAGFILGGFVPVAGYTIAHTEVSVDPHLWVLVGGSLSYSAWTVIKWGILAFRNTFKSIGFTVLIEGTMTFAHTEWLSIAGLVLLILINGIATGTNLALDGKK